ncbi:MAG: hypothetical protein Q7S89_01460 [bacterium]|nr:hypothetical protein [bacterium]
MTSKGEQSERANFLGRSSGIDDVYIPNRTLCIGKFRIDIGDDFIGFRRALRAHHYQKGAVDFLPYFEQMVQFVRDVKEVVREQQTGFLQVWVLLYIIVLPFNTYGLPIFPPRIVKVTEIVLAGVFFAGVYAYFRKQLNRR